MSIGLSELIIIVIVAVCLISPKNAQKLAKSLGKGFREFKEATKGLSEIKENVAEEKREMDEVVHDATRI